MRKKTIGLRILSIFIFILLITSISVSCQKKQEKPSPPEEKEDPKELKEIDEKIEGIIKDIESLQEEMKKPEKPPEQKQEQQQTQGGQSQGEGQSGQQGGQEQQGQEQQQGQQGEQQKPEEDKEDKINKAWEKINGDIEKLHSSWNTYEIKGIEKGIKEDEMNKFEGALNALTIAGDQKNILEALIQSNNMTLHLGDFFEFYKGSGESETMRMKYHTRQTYLSGLIGDWEGAKKAVAQAEPVVNRIRQIVTLEKKDEKLIEKLRLSVEDMKEVLGDTNKELLKIKRDIVLKNLEAINEAAK